MCGELTQDRLNGAKYTSVGRTARQQKLYAAMVSCATRRDRLCFASHTTLARLCGCSRRTVLRVQQELEAEGLIVRREQTLPSGQRWRTCVWGFPSGQRRLPRRQLAAPGFPATSTLNEASGVGNEPEPGVASPSLSHNCLSGRRSTSKTRPKTPELKLRRTSRYARRALHRGRRHRIVEQAALFPSTTEVVVRKNGSVTAYNAGDVIAAVVVAADTPVPPIFKARMGRDAKALLEAGFDPPTVCAACLCALRASRPHLVQTFANDIALAKRGYVWTWSNYRRFLEKQALTTMPDAVLEAMKDYFA